MLSSFASNLGVSVIALQRLNTAWSHADSAWIFPMLDEDGNTIGLRLRSLNGGKWAKPGSRGGLFYMRDRPPTEKCVLICEGPTDTAAAVTLGFWPIGRPNCASGIELIKATLDRLKIYKAIIAADNDEGKEISGKLVRPGIQGANNLARQIGVRHVVWIPPTKDLREFLKLGGTRATIENDVKQMMWKV